MHLVLQCVVSGVSYVMLEMLSLEREREVLRNDPVRLVEEIDRGVTYIWVL